MNILMTLANWIIPGFIVYKVASFALGIEYLNSLDVILTSSIMGVFVDSFRRVTIDKIMTLNFPLKNSVYSNKMDKRQFFVFREIVVNSYKFYTLYAGVSIAVFIAFLISLPELTLTPFLAFLFVLCFWATITQYKIYLAQIKGLL